MNTTVLIFFFCLSLLLLTFWCIIKPKSKKTETSLPHEAAFGFLVYFLS